jgi:hypothetical protein
LNSGGPKLLEPSGAVQGFLWLYRSLFEYSKSKDLSRNTVDKATGWTTRVSVTGRGNKYFFLKNFQTASGAPPSGCRGPSPGREASPSPEVKNEWSCTCPPPLRPDDVGSSSISITRYARSTALTNSQHCCTLITQTIRAICDCIQNRDKQVTVHCPCLHFADYKF